MVIYTRLNNFFLKHKKTSLVIKIFIALLLVKIFVFRILPYKDLSQFKKQNYSIQFYDRNENLLYVSSLEDGKRREYISLKEVPNFIIQAFLASEDKRFYFHNGIDYLSIIRALNQNISSNKKVSGASTITMQLARMVSPSEKRNFLAKIKDVYNAYRIESKLSKKKILELYLNSVPFGNNVEGISSAARFYFSKEVKDLLPEEALCLSVIPRRPELYSPFKNPEKCFDASKQVLEKLKNKKDFKSLYNKDDSLLVVINSVKEFNWPFYMPHFLRYVSSQVKKQNKYKYVLSVDLDLYDFIIYELNSAMKELYESRIENSSVLVIENKTGKVLSWIGNNNWYNSQGQIDGVLSKNQMGSSMKPFLYALALEKKLFSPNQILADIPMEFGTEKLYMPLNFNNRFNGPVSFRVALASSLNIPAVYILSELGVENYLDLLFALGFNSLRETGIQADLGLALGAGEVSLLELVNAFSVFARDGLYSPVCIFENDKKKEEIKIFEKDTARIICDILSDKYARLGGFGYTQTYQTSYPSIFKTGTSNQYQNIVALGSTVDYTVGVWMGNFTGETVIGKTGSSLPGYVARKILDFLNGDDYKEFLQAESFEKVPVCSLSGMSLSYDCPNQLYEFVESKNLDSFNLEKCNWHRKNDNGKVNVYYPAEYQQWFSSELKNSYIDYSSSRLKIVSPENYSVFYYSYQNEEYQKIPITVIGGKELEEYLTVIYDGEILKENDKVKKISRPFSFFIKPEKGYHNLKVILGDEEDEINFEVK